MPLAPKDLLAAIKAPFWPASNAALGALGVDYPAGRLGVLAAFDLDPYPSAQRVVDHGPDALLGPFLEVVVHRTLGRKRAGSSSHSQRLSACIWFVWAGGRIYLCVAGASVKVRNITANPAVSLALESGSSPVVVEGQAALLPHSWPEEAVEGFQRKYNWTITTDAEYNTLIAVTPERWLMAQE